MNRSWQISPLLVARIFFGWLVAVNLLALAVAQYEWWFLQTLLFISLVTLPGLVIARSLRLTFMSFTAGVLYVFGLSLFFLMLAGLIANQLQPVLGITQPLAAPWVMLVWTVMVVCLIFLAVRRNHQPARFRPWVNGSRSWVVLGIVTTSAALPVMACFGAFRLNNGGDEAIAFLTLYMAGGLIVALILLRKFLSDSVIALVIFSIALSILLMTSLRGWDIVGHDIQREFRVFTLTHLHGYWNIALNRDPYNACLSITVLPEVLVRILHVSGLVVFKFILQIVFAAAVVAIYVLLRQYVSKLGAIVGCVLFICYPTFINDSAMLTRQGVAYLFFALAFLAMMRRPSRWQHEVLFLLLSFGAILSHYSTAYMFVALFAGGVIIKYGLRFAKRLVAKSRTRRVQPTLLSPWCAAVLFFVTFTWYTQITETSTGLFVTIEKSLTNITTIFSDDNKSADTSSALLFGGTKTTTSIYQSYLDHANVSLLPGSADYLPALLTDTLPLTPLGQKMRSLGIDPSLIGAARQSFARVLQGVALAGVALVAYHALKRKSELPDDMVFFSISAIVILSLLTLLPVVSVNYGILRAFQQSLIFLIVPIVVLLVAVGRRFSQKVKLPTILVGTLFLFCLFTGIFTQLLGGASPSLPLNNQGLYYGLYYSPTADLRAFDWLKRHVPKKGDVRAANFNRAFMHDPSYPFNRAGILPSQVRDTSFIYADEAQVVAQRFYTYYDSSPLIMSFPLDYYDLTKDVIYSTSTTRMYR